MSVFARGRCSLCTIWTKPSGGCRQAFDFAVRGHGIVDSPHRTKLLDDQHLAVQWVQTSAGGRCLMRGQVRTVGRAECWRQFKKIGHFDTCFRLQAATVGSQPHSIADRHL